ncbi:MAG TPA: primosomal protein N' [Opitutales bacterium]|nr:primosomal protein N' [Opitutales bacterium]
MRSRFRTPSLETLHNVERGKYRCSRLLKRVDDRQLPMVHVVDMRYELLSKKSSLPLSRMLVEKMRQRLEKGEQTILFINRRGYSSSMICPECGFVCECDHCSITLTYHRSDETLKCHLCALVKAAPVACPACRSPKIRWRGFGTQRVEETLQKVFPGAKVERIDTDSMSKKNRFREILGEFRTGKIDVLVGTQMIAKGLDFPNVTLVGLVDADLSLHIPDFRANERTFQLLVQVAGRAGRGDLSGEVVVQTFTPHADPIQYARRDDFDGFSENELESRRNFAYPPYRHLIHHLFHGRNPEKVSFFAEQWVKVVEKEFGDVLEIRGPVPAPLEKVKDKYRFQIWYFCGNVSRIIGRFQQLRLEFPWPNDVVQVVDVDAVNLS